MHITQRTGVLNDLRCYDEPAVLGGRELVHEVVSDLR